MLVKKQFPSEWTLVLSLTLAFNTWIPFQIGSLLSLSPQESFSCKLLILQQCTLTMHIHYALYLSVSCTSLIAVIFPHNSILSKSLRSLLNTSTTCKLLILKSSVVYHYYGNPIQWCTLTIEVHLSSLIRNRRYLCLFTLQWCTPTIEAHFSVAHSLSKSLLSS